MNISKLEYYINFKTLTFQKYHKNSHLTLEEKAFVSKWVNDYPDIFHLPGLMLTCSNLIQHRIPTTDDKLVAKKPYRHPQAASEEINVQLNKQLKSGIIQDSKSPNNSPVLIIPKKIDASGKRKFRVVVDFRTLNEKVIGDEYLRMPMGIKNAPATFQRLMDNVLTGMHGTEAFIYLDDIIVHSETLEDHDIKVRRLFDRLRWANLKLQPDKCEFLRTEVAYLGHIIGRDGVRPNPTKIEAIKNFPVPKTVKAVRQFLGLSGYYRRFIKDYAKLAKPLTEFLKKDTKFQWGTEQTRSF